jgi:uncharacterized membrane protein YeaQ/YmgE (transglycosylase-associated protein family)
MILGFIWTLFLGGLAGWIAGKLMGSEGSMLRNVVLGLIGGVVGSFVLGLVCIQGRGLIGGTVVSVVGASILIWLGKKF